MPNWPAVKMLDTATGSNVPTATQLRRLEQIGLSRVGVLQVTRGEVITSTTDRAVVARLAAWAVSDGSDAWDRT
jgi:hypothetical protein